MIDDNSTKSKKAQSPKKNCAYLYFHLQRYLAPRYLKTKHVVGKRGSHLFILKIYDARRRCITEYLLS